MLNLLPYISSIEGYNSYDQKVGRHISQCRILGRVVVVMRVGPYHTLALYIPFHLHQGLLFRESATNLNVSR